MFLTVEQLKELTGYVQPRAQVQWLRKNGVHHYVRANGHPAVLISAISPAPNPAQSGAQLPDFDAVRIEH
jgi:hypothetical protein